MDIVKKLTVKNLTPPGYFNLSETASDFHKAYITWWDNILANRASQAVALRTLILTPWLVTYNNYPRASWLQYLLNQYGFGYFGGTNSQAAYLYKLVSNAWQRSVLTNMVLVAQTLCLPPFSWFEITSSPIIMLGYLVSAISDTGFLIYSTSGSLPSAPATTTYTPRAWATPAGWTRTASSATFYSRGYISGGNIVWCTPRSISDFNNNYTFSAAVPSAVPSAGTVSIVDDDGSGDILAVYYSDGTAWRKNSTPNADLGTVLAGSGVRPIPEAIAVGAPDPATITYAIASNNPPPANGPTQGEGTFATASSTTIDAGKELITFNQLSGGSIAIATMIDLFRRIKPLNQSINIRIDGVLYTITDSRQV